MARESKARPGRDRRRPSSSASGRGKVQDIDQLRCDTNDSPDKWQLANVGQANKSALLT